MITETDLLGSLDPASRNNVHLEQSGDGSGEDSQRSNDGRSAASGGRDGASGRDNGIPNASAVGLLVQVDEGKGNNVSSAVRVVTGLDLAVVLTHSRGDNGDLVDVALDVVDPGKSQSAKLRSARGTNSDAVLGLLGVVIVVLLGFESGDQSGLQGNFSTVQPASSAHGVGIQSDIKLDILRVELKRVNFSVEFLILSSFNLPKGCRQRVC